jgi:hypothetical protein
MGSTPPVVAVLIFVRGSVLLLVEPPREPIDGYRSFRFWNHSSPKLMWRDTP